MSLECAVGQAVGVCGPPACCPQSQTTKGDRLRHAAVPVGQAIGVCGLPACFPQSQTTKGDRLRHAAVPVGQAIGVRGLPACCPQSQTTEGDRLRHATVPVGQAIGVCGLPACFPQSQTTKGDRLRHAAVPVGQAVGVRGLPACCPQSQTTKGDRLRHAAVPVGQAIGVRGLPAYALAVLLSVSSAAIAGPPFQTDDPEPIDFRNYEFYTFATADGTPLETDTFGPALEFNWGALPNVHLHVILPAAAIFPADGPRAFGLGDMELGIKYRFVQETKHRPMIGTFVMFEMPTGNAARGLGVGRTWYKVPIWVQKSFGPWTTYGGAGVTLIKAPGYRNFPFAGWLVQRDLGKKLTLGAELFYHGPEGIGTPQTRPATLIDIGGYYKFRDPGFQLLFCYGHTAIGQSENYEYLGLYWTWGKKKPDDKQSGAAFSRMGPPGPMSRL